MRPFRLTAPLVAKPWGGRRLAGLGHHLPPDVAIGEAWVVADLTAEQTTVPDPVSRVVGGRHDGRTLHELLRDHADDLLGSAAPTTDGRFPLLVKHLDAVEPLSVQVHPPDALVTPGSGWSSKTESWVVMTADPGAVLYLGLQDGTTEAEVEAATGTPGIVRLLRRVPARVGDVHHLPAGLIHALGAGVVVAEVQTPSDTTFRLYDWTEELGRDPRDLHVEPGTRSILASWDLNLAPPAPVEDDGPVVATPHYRIVRHTDASPPGTGDRPVGPTIVMIIDGAAVLDGLDGTLTRGGVAVVPATHRVDVDPRGPATWLTVTLGG